MPIHSTKNIGGLLVKMWIFGFWQFLRGGGNPPGFVVIDFGFLASIDDFTMYPEYRIQKQPSINGKTHFFFLLTFSEIWVKFRMSKFHLEWTLASPAAYFRQCEVIKMYNGSTWTKNSCLLMVKLKFFSTYIFQKFGSNSECQNFILNGL